MVSLRIVSRKGSPFQDREEAGRLLGGELGELRGRNPVVLGIPRGGLIVARALAGVLGAPFDAVFALNLLTEGHPGFSMGAIGEDGRAFIDEAFVGNLGIRAHLEQEREERATELSRRAGLIRGLRQKIPLAGRTVIVVDDGLSSGSTMRAALRIAGEERPRMLLGTVPVGLDGAVEKAAELADRFLCLQCPPGFVAVSQFYLSFPQVGDAEIVRLFQD